MRAFIVGGLIAASTTASLKRNALLMTAVTLRHVAEFLPLDRCETMMVA